MKKTLLFLFVLSINFSFSQEHAWIYLGSKANVATYLANPLTMLTQKALDRRTTQGISLEFSDVPVTPSYITDISSATGITYVGASKWLNTIHVIGSQVDISTLSTTFSYIDSIEFADNSLNPGGKGSSSKSALGHVNKFPKENTSRIAYDYGQAQNQMEMFKAHKLHELDFTGAGITIAVIDAGFPNVDTNAGFDKIRTNGQILGGYDFVNDSANFYTGNSHGSNVLSFIAGYYDGATKYIGSAPEASFYLYISEDAIPETPAEETYWVMAAEQADYVGVDIINTSLGYTTFDESKYNYDYTTDLDGSTSFITRGAEIAYTKGMVVINAAGNSGADGSWGGRVGVPADGPNVFTIGAVNSAGTYASFSSKGPTSDNRLKPDVCVQGQGASYINTSGTVSAGNGTSYSSPLLAGGVACLWQALPGKTNAEIIQYVKESSSIYATPNYELGYGIPNLELARSLSVSELELNEVISIYPNPATDNVKVNLPKSMSKASVTVFNVLGKKIITQEVNGTEKTIKVSHLNRGIYLLKFTSGNMSQTLKLVKE
ncbi:MAG: S8 family serine peptidase [Flavobacteriaceae bacterium]|nr:S8 family serine peptidase [Flavobacteriaceae bacterium]